MQTATDEAEVTSRFTEDPQDPLLQSRPDPSDRRRYGTPRVWLILPAATRAATTRMPKTSYWHDDPNCGKITTIAPEIAQTFAADPGFYNELGTYCMHCGQVRPVAEFLWCDEDNVATMAPSRQQRVGT